MGGLGAYSPDLNTSQPAQPESTQVAEHGVPAGPAPASSVPGSSGGTGPAPGPAPAGASAAAEPRQTSLEESLAAGSIIREARPEVPGSPILSISDTGLSDVAALEEGADTAMSLAASQEQERVQGLVLGRSDLNSPEPVRNVRPRVDEHAHPGTLPGIATAGPTPDPSAQVTEGLVPEDVPAGQPEPTDLIGSSSFPFVSPAEPDTLGPALEQISAESSAPTVLADTAASNALADISAPKRPGRR